MDYSKYEKKARAKINKYGGTCTITRQGDDEVYNEETCEYESTETTISGKAILSSFDETQINGTSVLAGDLKLMCVLDSEPLLTDKISFGGKVYSIININAINPNGDCVIYYDLQVR